MLETVGKIIDRMSELKGLAGQDPMKSEMDKYSYNNEFKDLQMQLYSITNEQFNGVSFFANYTSDNSKEVFFYGMYQDRESDHTISIHTSQNGSSGAKVSLHKSMLRSALSVRMDLELGWIRAQLRPTEDGVRLSDKKNPRYHHPSATEKG